MTILPGGGLLHGPGQAAQPPVPAVLAEEEAGVVHPGPGRKHSVLTSFDHGVMSRIGDIQSSGPEADKSV